MDSVQTTGRAATSSSHAEGSSSDAAKTAAPPVVITTSASTPTASVAPSASTTTTVSASGTAASAHEPDSSLGVPPTTTQESDTNSSSATAAAATAAATVVADENSLQNQKLVEEFQYLLEKSQNLFSGLRDLPPTGSHRQWRPYFEKTFEVYTKLWKFQQTHRAILEDKNNYGLKRWEVGEIASKIGQLYYHYYLRTSDTSYLLEAYVFYEAIHERQYFKDVLEAKNPALMIKKMRYYARFIVVSLLLNKYDNIRLLISELEGLVDEYTKSFKPPDAKEWQTVLDEISTFMEAEKRLAPINADGTPVTVVHRLLATSPTNERESFGPRLKLQEAILVGNSQKQIKFSELTLDMYRILQSLEIQLPTPPQTTGKGSGHESKEPVMTKEESTATRSTAGGSGTASASAASNMPPSGTGAQQQQSQSDKGVAHRRTNPHKYLLYRPSLSQLFVYLSTAFKDTADNGVMLLYLSADGCKYTDAPVPGYQGGVAAYQRKQQSSASGTLAAGTVDRSDHGQGSASGMMSGAASGGTASATNVSATASNAANGSGATAAAAAAAAAASSATPLAHCLHPADLVPFTRKSLFLIVDSDNSIAFKNLPNVFDQPVMSLLSPVEYPSSIQDKTEIGSLFTLFLHTPMLGFCSVSDIGNLDQAKWESCVTLISRMEQKIGELLIGSPDVDLQVKRFMMDEFLRVFIVRFALCNVILRSHSSFKEEKFFPVSSPALPEIVYRTPEVIEMLQELTLTADVATYFSLPFATNVPLET